MGDWFGGGVREWVGATELYRVQADPLACAKRSAEDSVAAALGRLLLSLLLSTLKETHQLGWGSWSLQMLHSCQADCISAGPWN